MSKRKMSLPEACAFVPDDLPDGAYWAMAHDIAGADYGEAWGELNGEPVEKLIPCPAGCKKQFATERDRDQHVRMKHHKGKKKP